MRDSTKFVYGASTNFKETADSILRKAWGVWNSFFDLNSFSENVYPIMGVWYNEKQKTNEAVLQIDFRVPGKDELDIYQTPPKATSSTFDLKLLTPDKGGVLSNFIVNPREKLKSTIKTDPIIHGFSNMFDDKFAGGLYLLSSSRVYDDNFELKDNVIKKKKDIKNIQVDGVGEMTLKISKKLSLIYKNLTKNSIRVQKNKYIIFKQEQHNCWAFAVWQLLWTLRNHKSIENILQEHEGLKNYLHLLAWDEEFIKKIENERKECEVWEHIFRGMGKIAQDYNFRRKKVILDVLNSQQKYLNWGDDKIERHVEQNHVLTRQNSWPQYLLESIVLDKKESITRIGHSTNKVSVHQISRRSVFIGPEGKIKDLENYYMTTPTGQKETTLVLYDTDPENVNPLRELILKDLEANNNEETDLSSYTLQETIGSFKMATTWSHIQPLLINLKTKYVDKTIIGGLIETERHTMSFIIEKETFIYFDTAEGQNSKGGGKLKSDKYMQNVKVENVFYLCA